MSLLLLKDYQSEVLSDLQDFVSLVVENGNIANSYRQYWLNRGIVLGTNNFALKPYNDSVSGVPRVTSKVPTAGGKTFIACNAIATIFNNLPPRDAKVVAWFVPSDTILEQTLAKLRDASHPYRQCLDTLFNGRVAIVDKESALMGTNISPTEVREQLTIFILSAASFIDTNRQGLAPRVFRDNGNLDEYAKLFDNTTKRVENSGETGLIQVLSYLNPLVIVDESHNFTAELRNDMLNNVNPCFIYELTATPRDSANIISFIGAEKLKFANMVKLPVIVHNDETVDAVIANAINMRHSLEEEAIKVLSQGGEYIRPIVLFQAQPKTDDDSETFEKIKERLVTQYEIPEEQIKIKTANINELKNIDLMSPSCPVRFIITVNALKEGWDCPFAYILASLANRTSKIDVEQILGRVLRQPYAKKHAATFLNLSYTFTCSKDFQQTLDNIIKSLNKSGFSAKDYRCASSLSTSHLVPISIDPVLPTQADNLFTLDNNTNSYPRVEEPSVCADSPGSNPESFEELDFASTLSQEQRTTLANHSHIAVQNILESAQSQSEEYEREMASHEDSPIPNLPSEVENDAHVYPLTDCAEIRNFVNNLEIPQFCVPSDDGLLDDIGPNLLEKDVLLEGFDLETEDSNITFDPSESATRIIDLDQTKDFVPAQGGLNDVALNLFRQYYMTLNTQGKVRELVAKIVQAINIQGISDGKITTYVRKVLERKNSDELISLAANLGNTITAFKNKINDLAAEYRKRKFLALCSVEQIFCEPTFKLKSSIVLPKTSPTLFKSLYRAEDHMNNFEFRVIQKIADLDNVLFWHRNVEHSGFRINGFINHYPDFIVVTKGGKVIMVEAKGDDRQNPDSEAKLILGEAWANAAGTQYRYFMVFDNKPLAGAKTLNNFISILAQLR